MMSMVFGSNASASSWVLFRRAIEALIIEYSTRLDLISKHKDLLDMLKWEDEDTHMGNFVRAVACPLNPGIQDFNGFLEAFIYIDDILASANTKFNMLHLLAATIKAIFTVCGQPHIEVRQCPLSLEKWNELVVSTVQIALGLTVDMNKLTVGITPEYRNQVRELLLESWSISRRIF